MINAWILPLVLATSGGGGAPSFIQKIKIAESLVIEAHYMPEGSMLPTEGMVLSVEDFGLLQAEVENSGGACELRLMAMEDQQNELLQEAQQRCLDRHEAYKVDLDKANALNLQLKETLAEERANHKLQMWVSIGLVVTGAVVTAAVVSN